MSLILGVTRQTLRAMYKLPVYLLIISLLGNMAYSAPGNAVGVGRSTIKLEQYVLSPNDLIRITVFQEEDLTTEIRVQGDGYIMLPLIGRVKVGGLTVMKAQEFIQAWYAAEYLVDPHVTLIVLEHRVRSVQVIGQVNRPGLVEIPAGEKLTLTQAIATAGGFNLRADKKKVQLTKSRGDGRPPRVEYYDVKEILKNPVKARNPILSEGDTVFVKESAI